MEIKIEEEKKILAENEKANKLKKMKQIGSSDKLLLTKFQKNLVLTKLRQIKLKWILWLQR